MLRAIYRIFKGISICIGVLICGVIALFYYCGHDLPNHEFLQHYKPPEGSRIYDNGNNLYRELISEYRIFVPIHEIPPQLIKAFLAAEDKNFYYHPGIDVLVWRVQLYEIRCMENGTQNPLGPLRLHSKLQKTF